jgi:hypothetical protein
MMVRWREFGLLRWLGLALLPLGGTILFGEDAWWAGLVLAAAGLVLLERDNARLRCRRHLDSGAGDSDA